MEYFKQLRRIEAYILFFAVFLFPSTVISTFANVVDTPRMALMVFSLALILILKSVRALVTNKIHFSSSQLDIPVFLVVLVYLLSTVFETPNKFEAVFLPGTASLVVMGGILFFLVNQLNAREKVQFKVALIGSAVFYSLMTLFVTAGVFSAIPQMPDYLKNTSFNFAGAPLPGIIFIASILPLTIHTLLKETDMPKKVFFGVSVGLMAFAGLINVVNALPGKPTSPRLPTYQVSWEVAVDSLKANPLLGMGPGNYLTAFNLFRPLEYNATENWATRFTAGRSFIFTMTTETGIAGLASFALLIYALFKLLKSRQPSGMAISLAIAALALLLFPASPTTLIVFFMLAALFVESRPGTTGALNYDNQSSSRLPILVVVVPALLAVGLVSFYTQRILAADTTYKNSLYAIARNDGSSAYTLLQQAINTNPYIDRYRVTYAQINLAIANSLASSEEISEQDRNTIAQLVQQAIREGKVAVNLNPQRASNWEILASIYRSIAPLAEGANDFAAQTYSQAIALDPLNTNARIALGGIFYSVGQYENAIDIFQLAVRTKPDHANAHYNLAIAYRENGQIEEAIAEMTNVLSLVDRNSDDFELAKKTLEELEAKRTNTQAEGSTNLTPPEGPQEPALEPPLELPEDAEPPEPEATPTPTPTATPEASASPEASPTATPAP